jgi:outer membrane biosynthesis protein TonB
MKLQDLPKTAAETTVNLVRLPVGLVTKAREVVEERLGGGDAGAEISPTATEPAVEPTKAKTAKPKATPKKPAAKKPAAKRKPKAPAKPTKPSAASTPTPTKTATAAERAGVVGEEGDGLDEAVDRAQFELHKRDVDVNGGEAH